MNHQLLTRAECKAMRGLAIIGIFMHNYCHWLNPVVKENEYQYFQSNTDWFRQVLSAPDELLPMHLLSFFGHYGVPVFLFLSAYGLVMKYETSADGQSLQRGRSGLEGVFSFMQHHYKKLFKMMILGFVAFTMTDLMTPKSHHYAVLDIVAMLGMFNNLLPNPDDIIWPGPYWFFGLMIQFYIVYRLCLYRRHWLWNVLLIVICATIQLACDPDGEALNRWRYNFIGGMLPFGFGVLYARYMRPLNTATHLVLFVLSLFAIIMLSFNYITWYFVPLAVCIASVSFVKLASRLQIAQKEYKTGFMAMLTWVGSISAALFVCHPITRKIFIPLSREGDYWTGLLLYIISSICLAWLFKELMKRIPSPRLKN